MIVQILKGRNVSKTEAEDKYEKHVSIAKKIANWKIWFEGEGEEKWRIQATYLSSVHNLRLKKENTA